jgi:hypothetical protein
MLSSLSLAGDESTSNYKDFIFKGGQGVVSTELSSEELSTTSGTGLVGDVLFLLHTKFVIPIISNLDLFIGPVLK